MERSQFTLPAIILGVALIVTGTIGTIGIFKIRSFNDTISVTGSAEQMISSDVVKWNMQIVRSADLNGVQSANADMSDDLAKLRTFFSENNISEEWVTVAPMSVDTMFDYNSGGAPSGYTLRQNITVESQDVDTVARAAQASSSLLSEGALVSTLSLEYYFSDLQSLKQDILAAAMKDAQERAQKMVEASGGKVGALRTASMGVLQVTAKNSIDISDYGMYDTSAREKKVTAVVRASFGVR